jgi:hypothetical protein
MFCNYCRASNPNDAVYCSECGRTIKPPDESKNAEQKRKTIGADVSSSGSASLTKPREQESPAAIAKPPGNDNSPENLAAAIPAIPKSVAKSPDEESSSWDYAKMSDEELDQLRESYQKLRVPIHPTLQSEIERRGRKDKVLESKGTQVSDHRPEGSLRSDSLPIPNPNLGQSSPHAQAADESTETVAKREGTSGWVILGIFLAMGFALEASFLAVRQTSNEKIVESLTKLVLYFALAGWGLLRAISGGWLTLKRVLLIAGVFYVGGLSCMLVVFPRAPAGDRLLKAVGEFQFIGQQINQIENRKYDSPQDYIDALLQIEPLMGRWRQVILEAQQASSSLSTSLTPQDLQLQVALSLVSEKLALKEQEIALAHEMQNLPREERQQFFDSKLMPLFRR